MPAASADRCTTGRENSVTTPRIRHTRPADIPALIALQARVYPTIPPWSRRKLGEQLDVFPQGQIVLEQKGLLLQDHTDGSIIIEVLFQGAQRGGSQQKKCGQKFGEATLPQVVFHRETPYLLFLQSRHNIPLRQRRNPPPRWERQMLFLEINWCSTHCNCRSARWKSGTARHRHR